MFKLLLREPSEEPAVETTKPIKNIAPDAHKTVSTNPMTKITESAQSRPDEGDLVEGLVVATDKAALYVDLPPYGTGIIYGREFMNARDLIKKINIGDAITAKVIEPENEDGYVELSLKEARQALTWSEAEEAIKNKTVFNLEVKDANKGGLILEWQGIQGFLPASQLKAEHYPRVEDGNKDAILAALQKFVGETLGVCVLSANAKEGKLIFSEKGLEEKERSELVEKYAVGDVVEGEITGIVDFGLFVKVEEGLEGLVHISEMDWGLVEDPRAMFKVGEKVKTKIIEIRDGKISLSIKTLKENPWIEAEKKYKKDDVVSGVVIKYNKHGALVSLEEGVAGLVHISEFGSDEKLRETLELGKSYPVKIVFFEPKNQRMTLSYSGAQEEAAAEKATLQEAKPETE
ncbi:MAG: S1 RNA-binding domain-containing protein [Parcubacteria group bacterium]|nr:S1 RNA-binding domain-containing protein [Parcubacteria group bacterium]